MNKFNRYLLGTYEHSKEKVQTVEVKEAHMDIDVETDKVLEFLNSSLKTILTTITDLLETHNLDTSLIESDKNVFKKNKPKPKTPDYSCNFAIMISKGQKEVARTISEKIVEAFNTHENKHESIQIFENSQFGHINVFLTEEAHCASLTPKMKKGIID